MWRLTGMVLTALAAAAVPAAAQQAPHQWSWNANGVEESVRLSGGVLDVRSSFPVVHAWTDKSIAIGDIVCLQDVNKYATVHLLNVFAKSAAQIQERMSGNESRLGFNWIEIDLDPADAESKGRAILSALIDAAPRLRATINKGACKP